jgi:hypothetical protein
MKLANDRFEATNDKRKADAAKWLRELGRMAEKTAKLLKGEPDKPAALNPGAGKLLEAGAPETDDEDL